MFPHPQPQPQSHGWPPSAYRHARGLPSCIGDQFVTQASHGATPGCPADTGPRLNVLGTLSPGITSVGAILENGRAPRGAGDRSCFDFSRSYRSYRLRIWNAAAETGVAAKRAVRIEKRPACSCQGKSSENAYTGCVSYVDVAPL
jgi:hypothetical protein